MASSGAPRAHDAARIRPPSPLTLPLLSPAAPRRQHRQDAVVPHAVRHQPDAILAGRRRGQGVLHRHRCAQAHTFPATYSHLTLSPSPASEGTFRPERIKAIAERFNLDPDAVLSNIIWARVYTADALADVLVSVAAQFVEQPFRLLVVDSVMAPFRVDYQGRGELSERQQKVGAIMSRLNKIGNEFNVAVVVTNQVMADPSGMTFAGADNKKVRAGG